MTNNEMDDIGWKPVVTDGNSLWLMVNFRG